jgi:hypothetical protein
MCRTVFWDAGGKPLFTTFNGGRANRLALIVPLKPINIPYLLKERGKGSSFVNFAFIYHLRLCGKPALGGTGAGSESGVLKRTAGTA